MEEKVRPSQRVTTLTTHTHKHAHTPDGHSAFTAAGHSLCHVLFYILTDSSSTAKRTADYVLRVSSEQGAEKCSCAALTAGRH